MAERVVSGKGKSGLRKRWPGLAAIGQDETGHDRDGAHRLRQPLIGIGQLRQKSPRLRRVHSVLGEQRQ